MLEDQKALQEKEVSWNENPLYCSLFFSNIDCMLRIIFCSNFDSIHFKQSVLHRGNERRQKLEVLAFICCMLIVCLP